MKKKNKSIQKRFQPKYKIRKGDRVRVISGASKGTEGEVLEMLPKTGRAIVEGANIQMKHTRPSNDNPGGINEVPGPIHLSNLMLIDPRSGEPTRVGRRVEEGKIVRYSKASGETIRE